MEKTPLEVAIADYATLKSAPGFVEISVPDENPGPPFYTRFGASGIGPYLLAGQTVVIPMMRNLDCIAPDFNLLDFYHVPDAFFCPIYLSGKALIESDASPEDFPVIAYLQSDDMPIWFVDHDALQGAMADGVLTLSRLEALNPKKGRASRYIEYNKPRPEGDYLLVIESEGTIPATGESFRFAMKETNRIMEEIQLKID